MRFIKIDPAVFNKMDYHVNVVSTGHRKCCCGFVDCTDPDCVPTPLADSSGKV